MIQSTGLSDTAKISCSLLFQKESHFLWKSFQAEIILGNAVEKHTLYGDISSNIYLHVAQNKLCSMSDSIKPFAEAEETPFQRTFLLLPGSIGASLQYPKLS